MEIQKKEVEFLEKSLEMAVEHFQSQEYLNWLNDVEECKNKREHILGQGECELENLFYSLGFSDTRMGFSASGMGLERFIIPSLIVRRAMNNNKRLEQFILVFIALLVDRKPKIGELDFIKILMDR